MAKHEIVFLDHTFREANGVVHAPEKFGRLLRNDYNLFEEAPEFLKILLQKDLLSIATCRVVEV